VRVLEIVHGLPPELVGGTEAYVDAVARSLGERGNDVAVLAGTFDTRPGFALRRESRAGYEAIFLHRGDLYFDDWDRAYHPEAARLVERTLEESRPDVVHVHHWIRIAPNLVQAAAARGVPAVVTIHDTWTSCLRCFRVLPDGRFCEEKARAEVCVPCVDRAPSQTTEEIEMAFRLFRADRLAEFDAAHRVLFPTPEHLEFLAAKGDFPRGSFAVFPHPRLFELAAGPVPPADGGRLRVVTWGHHHPAKGTHHLLEALARPGVAQVVELDIFGETVFPEYGERLRALAAGLPVRFRGAFDRADLAAEPFHLAAFPTLAHESHSFVLDEAFALGLPVLVPDRGALPRRAGSAGFVFRVGDADDLARRLLSISADRAGLARARSAAASRPEGPSLSEHVAALESLYHEAAREGPRRAAAGPSVEDRFRLEAMRSENRFRRLLRYEPRGR
jgi:glycosyltransferase involved in cell wall biosynthesis